MQWKAIFFLLTVVYAGRIVVESTQPHNKNCYTQGLFYLNATHLFEVCGLYGSSYYHILQTQSTPFQVRESFSTSIPWKNDVFLEGSIAFKGFIYILTWKEKKVYKLNATTLQLVKEISWANEGWGLTANQTHMFATDGSDKVYIVDQNFEIKDTKQVKSLNGYPETNINELQYVNGYILANIYLTAKIVNISTSTWNVTQNFDCSNITALESGQSGEVLNGIAYDKDSNKLILTGKHWSKYYQVSFVKFEDRLVIVMLLFLLLLLF